MTRERAGVRARACQHVDKPAGNRGWRATILTLALLSGPFGPGFGASGAPAATGGVARPSTASHGGCLPTGNGFLRARLRGALDLDLDWHDAEMECQGGLRPGGGIRVGISGPKQSDGRRLRFVFGISDAAEGRAGHALPTNVTVIFENEARLFSTRGDAWCTTDELSQERLGEHAGAPGGPDRTWRVIARGFCTAPASIPGQDARILVERFDFAGVIRVGSEDAAHP